jgi:hypothetical protein
MAGTSKEPIIQRQTTKIKPAFLRKSDEFEDLRKTENRRRKKTGAGGQNVHPLTYRGPIVTLVKQR